MELSVIIPVLNEEKNIIPLVTRLRQTLSNITEDYELLFINDGSIDSTLPTIKMLAKDDSRITYLDFSRNFGHQVALAAGLDYCAGDYVVIIDADLQDPPELLVSMMEKIKGGYEVVYAKRALRKGESFMKRWTAKVFYRLINRLASIDIPQDTGDFRVLQRPVVEVLKNMPEKHKFFRGQISWIGFRQTYVLYERDARHAGATNYPLRKMVRFALDGITAFSTTPLKLATAAGFIISALAFLLILWALFVRMLGERYGFTVERGWASQFIVTLFLGGIQLISIGILGEYIGRISDSIKNRPLYIIRDKSAGLQASPPAHA